MKWLLDWLINKNFIMKYIDGYKSQIAGVLIGIAFALDSIAGFLPPDVAAQVLIISAALKTIAGYFGVVGALGKVGKIGEKK